MRRQHGAGTSRATDLLVREHGLDPGVARQYAETLHAADLLRTAEEHVTRSLRGRMNSPVEQAALADAFGAVVLERCEARGVTLRSLAEAVGCLPATMSSYTRGVTVPPVEVADRIATALGTYLEHLVKLTRARLGE